MRCSAGGEKARIAAAGADSQANAFGALWAIALVGGLIAVDVDAGIDVAAGEGDAHEFPLARLVGARPIGRWPVGRKI